MSEQLIKTPVRYDDGTGIFYDADERWMTFGSGVGGFIAECINEYTKLRVERDAREAKNALIKEQRAEASRPMRPE